MNNRKGRPKRYYGKNIGVRLDALLTIQLEVKAQSEGKTFSDLIRELLKSSIDRESGNPEPTLREVLEEIKSLRVEISEIIAKKK